MILNTKLNFFDSAQKVSVFSFIVLFPFFIIYNLLITNGLFPPILGGYFGIATAFVTIILFPYILVTTKKSFSANIIFTFLNYSIFCLAGLITFLNYMSNNFPDAVFQSVQTLIFWFSFYSLGFYFIQKDNIKTKKFLIYFILLFLIYNIFNVISTGNLSFSNTADDLLLDENTVSGYQSIARNLLIISLFCYAFIENKIKQLAFLVLSLFCIFIIGARSELAALVLSIIFLNMLLSFRQKFNFYITIAIFLILALALSIFWDTIQDSRQFQLLEFSKSSSWYARQAMQDLAVHQITEHPIIGYFGGHVLYMHTGTYAHNALSAYVNYGLMFFLVYSGLNLYTFFYSLYQVVKQPYDKNWLFCFLMSFTTVLLIVMAKPVFWPIPFLTWGIFMGLIYLNKKHKNSN